MEGKFMGYISNGRLYGVRWDDLTDYKRAFNELGYSKLLDLFKDVVWVTPPDDMSVGKADRMGFKYNNLGFSVLCEKRDTRKTIKCIYRIEKYLHKEFDNPALDGMLSDEDNENLRKKIGTHLKDLISSDKLYLFNKSYKFDNDYKNAEEYFVVDFDKQLVYEK